MRRFDVMPDYEADCPIIQDEVRIAEVYHYERNAAGGSVRTPIARYFAWKPEYAENFHDHWRIDCYVRQHERSPDPKTLGRTLRNALIRESLCSEPCWVAWHRSEAIGGEAAGDVYDLD